LLQELISLLQLPYEAVEADANYDIEEALPYIFSEMKAKPVTPKNPRGHQKDEFQVKKNTIIFSANLEMYIRGKMTTRGRTYFHSSSPLHSGRVYQGRFLLYPAFHPKYFTQNL